MLFSSIPFILYFLPITLIVYYILSFSRTAQNVWLLIVSLVFYAWGEPYYVLLLLLSIVFNSVLALIMDKKQGKLRKALLVIDIVFNVGMLFIFKYLNFILEMFGARGRAIEEQLGIVLPIGISFYTFQALSYVIDVYRQTTKAENPFYVGLYISFFPQLIAGPIVQYNAVSEQIRNRKCTFDKLSLGISRFAVGVGKKIILANSFAAIADNVFNWSNIGTDKLQVPATLAWLGSIAYSLQIYFDFSAYSDMAIGLGLCFGFKFRENFNYPYIATSISDFWNRWHISLTDWFRDYVYIPLGGNRGANRDTMVRNMAIVWALTGIWHGANWTFIFWGIFYFTFQLLERFLDYENHVRSIFLRHVITLFIVNALWVLFRADNLYQAGRFYMNMLGINDNGFLSDTAFMLVKENWLFLILGILFSTPVVPKINSWLYQNEDTKVHALYSVLYPLAMLAMMVVCFSYLIIGSYNPFIYFNF
ncbi:MAG: MBOAT family protein [Butyrivibrio sp.]|nr:MBOAT family protein [Butyrivibrio sp.]